MFDAQSTAKGHIRARQTILLPQVNFLPLLGIGEVWGTNEFESPNREDRNYVGSSHVSRRSMQNYILTDHRLTIKEGTVDSLGLPPRKEENHSYFCFLELGLDDSTKPTQKQTRKAGRHSIQSYIMTYYRLKKTESLIALRCHLGGGGGGGGYVCMRGTSPRGGDRFEHPRLAGGGGPKLLCRLLRHTQ